MAIYHASVKSFSRKDGQSSVAAAAYRAGINITCETTGSTHKYSRRKGVASHHMLAPKDAPSWCLDVKTFWSANEAAETRKNARLCRELEFSLPSELNEELREKLALAVGQMLVDRYNVVVMAAIHEPGQAGDNRNHHVHLLMSAREVGPNGLGDRAAKVLDERMGAGPNEIRALREQVALITNAHLEAAGFEERIDHRTLKAQAEEAEANGNYAKAAVLTRTPTKHMGKAVTARTRRGLENDRGWHRRYTIIDNRMLLQDYLARAEEEARLQPSSPLHSHVAALQERAREDASSASLERFTQQLRDMARGDQAVEKAPNIFHGGGYDPFAQPAPLEAIDQGRKRPVEALRAPIDESYGRLFASMDDDWLAHARPLADIALPTPGEEIEPSPPRPDIEIPRPKGEIEIPPPKGEIAVPAPKPEVDVAQVMARKGRGSRAGASITPSVNITRTGGRIARATGAGAEVLNAQANIIEEWLASQVESCRAYLEGLKQVALVPGVEFMDAVEAMNVHRVVSYWHKPMLRKDIEGLAEKCEVFIRAATERQRREDAAWRAEARLSEVRTDIAQQMITNPHPGPSANRCDSKNWEKWRDGLKQKLIKASRDRDKVRRALDAGSQRKCERILSQARSSMVEETQRIERLYPIPVPPELVDDLRSFRFPSGPTKHSPLDGPSPPSPQPKLRRYPKMRPPR